MGVTVIGLTGNIGSGKTTLSEMLAKEKQCLCLNADQIGKKVAEPDGAAYAALRRNFDARFFLPDGRLNRPKMAELVFNDSAALNLLNSIIHPVVLQTLCYEIDKAYEEAADRIIVVEAALLVEANYLGILDQLWLVWADDDIRLRRVMGRDKLTAEQALARMNNQMPQAEKAKLAQFVLHNNGDIDSLRKELNTIWDKAFTT